jgi:hypothetical protein
MWVSVDISHCNYLPTGFRELSRTEQNSAKDSFFQGPVPASSHIAARAAQRHLKTGSVSPRVLAPPPNQTVFPSPTRPCPQSRAEIAGPCASVCPSVPLAKYPSNLCHGGPALSSRSLTDIPLSLNRAGLPSSKTAISSHHNQLHPRVLDTYTRF